MTGDGNADEMVTTTHPNTFNHEGELRSFWNKLVKFQWSSELDFPEVFKTHITFHSLVIILVSYGPQTLEHFEYESAKLERKQLKQFC